MPYLIDGNNVMAQKVGWHRDKAGARKQLIRDLAKFIAVHRVKVKVVFDGIPDAEFPDGCRYKSVHVFYARPGLDADSRIKEFTDKASYRRDLVVVTSDKALGSYVRHRGAKVQPSGKFRAALRDTLEMSVKNKGVNDPVDIKEWTEYFQNGRK
ncbi:NYN domain-containing protein [Thermodesulfobacteriota bacterium]